MNELIHDYPHQISFKGKVPEAEEIAAKRAEKVAALDGMSYEDVVKRMFTLTDAILELNTAIEKANYKRVKVTTYNYPMLTDETFGLSLIGLKKQLNRELESVRDELTAFNATHKIDYELPEGIL